MGYYYGGGFLEQELCLYYKHIDANEIIWAVYEDAVRNNSPICGIAEKDAFIAELKKWRIRCELVEVS